VRASQGMPASVRPPGKGSGRVTGGAYRHPTFAHRWEERPRPGRTPFAPSDPTAGGWFERPLVEPTMHQLPLLTSAIADLFAATPHLAVVAVKTLPQVIDGLKTWIMGILAAVATLFLVVGGLRYMTAAGDPAAVEQAKGSLKAALTGYALAVLAPVILQVLQSILGG
jgi:Type IV secretion system pilin